MHELPAMPGLYAIAGLACTALALICLIASAVTALYERKRP